MKITETLDETTRKKKTSLIVRRMVGGPVGSSAHPRQPCPTLNHTAIVCWYYMLPLFRLKDFFETLVKFHRITPHQGRVYQALLSYFGNKGCFPSHSTLAVESGVSERTVRNALREARMRGWITWTNKRIGRRQTSNLYQITVSSTYVNEVLNGLRQLKRKSAEISHFFRRQNLPGSPYFYIKKASQKIWNGLEQPSDGLTPWQELFRDNREAAMAQLRAL